MTGLPTIEDFIDYNPNVGPLQMIYIGYPGSGKSNHVTSLNIRTIGEKDEMGLTHGDLSCEWRHFTLYKKKIKEIEILVPKGIEIWWNPDESNPKYGPESWTEVDYNNFNIMDHLEPGKLVVVYDECYRSHSQTILWTNIMKDIWRRKDKIKETISYFCHEAGNTFPQTATKKQWEALDYYSELLVRFRKRKIRAIYVSQLENEIYYRLREKCIWRIYRLSNPSKRSIGRTVRKYLLRTRIDNYHLYYGDLFRPLNTNPKLKEVSDIWLMIPRDLVNLKSDSISTDGDEFPEKTCQKCGYIWKPRKADPKKCPRCATTKYDVEAVA